MNRQPSAWLRPVAAAIVLLAYVPFFWSLVDVSASNPYAGHVVFVPVFAGVLLWLERRRSRGSVGHASGAGLTALALVLAGIAYHLASLPLQALSFVAAVAGLQLWFRGVRGARAASFVLVFLLLMVPPPREVVRAIAPDVQQVVASFAVLVLESLRIPVEQHGTLVRLPGLALEVAEECAGLRFSFILFVFTAAFARGVLPRTSGQAGLMLLSVPVAMLANMLRVTVTAVGAYFLGPEVASGPIHYYIGKGFWVLALLAMILLALQLRSRAHHGRGELGEPANASAA